MYSYHVQQIAQHSPPEFHPNPKNASKKYFLRHREEITAFHACMDRINQRPRRIIASPNDPDFDEKVRAAIRRKLATAKKQTD
jgi:hypothetical protein